MGNPENKIIMIYNIHCESHMLLDVNSKIEVDNEKYKNGVYL